MSRASGPSGMLDIKSAALHMQQVNQTDPCAPGSKLYQKNLEDAKRHSSELDYIVGDDGHEGHRIGESVDQQDPRTSSQVSESNQQGYHSRTTTRTHSQSYESHRNHLGEQNNEGGGLQGGRNKNKDKDRNRRKKDKRKQKDDQKNEENNQQEILEIDDEGQEEDRRNNRYDRPRDWIITLAAALVVASIIGMMHCFPPLISEIMLHFKMGLIEVIAICCLSYAILIGFSPISAVLLVMTGNRVIAMIGLILFFIGLLLDSFCIHSAVFYFSHLVLLSIGGSFALTASGSIVSDHMRKNLQVGLTIISISAMIGTIIFYWLANFLLGYIIYRWVMLVFAIFLLLVLGTVMFFPKRCDAPPEALPWRRCHKRDPKIDMAQGCIEAYRKYDHYDENNECDPVTGKKIHPSYLCVLNCDCSICGDLSFLLWGLLCLLATMSTLVPLIFLPSFAADLGMNEKSLVVGIVLFCITSLVVRVVLLNYNDHTFFLNRLLFQVACVRILYIIIMYATTWGWLLLWGGALGITEGIFVIVIPRIALLTVPKDYVVTSWAFTLFFIAVAIVIGPMLVIIVKSCTGAYVVGFMAIGCLQIIAGLLALILPDEENFSNGYDDEECEDFEGQLANDAERQKVAEKERWARVQAERDARDQFLEKKRNPDYYRELANRLNSYQAARRATMRRSTPRSARSAGPEGPYSRTNDPRGGGPNSRTNDPRGGPNSRTNDPRGGPNSRNYDPRGGPNSRTNDPHGGGPNSRTYDPRSGPNSRTNDPRDRGGPNSRNDDPQGTNFDQRRRSTNGKYGPLHVHQGHPEQPKRKSIMEELARARGMSNGDPRSGGGPHNEDYKRRKTLAEEELLEGVRDLRDNVHEQKLEGVGARVPMPMPSNEPKTMYGLDLDEISPNLRRYLTGKDCDLSCARKKPPKTYIENCPICQMVGCMPGCCNINCTPGGLAGLISCDPEPDGNITTKTVTRQEYDC